MVRANPRCNAALTAAFALVTFIVFVRPANPQTLSATEYEIKAAYLYNFAKFVEWPSQTFQSENDPMVLCLLGEDPSNSTIDAMLTDKTIQNRKLVLKKLADTNDAQTCHVLFISPSEKTHLKSVLQKLDGKPVLTVSDIRDFIDFGGMIGFSMNNNKVQFNINNSAAESANLKLSSQILKLAKTVKNTSETKEK